MKIGHADFYFHMFPMPPDKIVHTNSLYTKNLYLYLNVYKQSYVRINVLIVNQTKSLLNKTHIVLKKFITYNFKWIGQNYKTSFS